MASLINIFVGTSPNDNTGDALRTAMITTNTNFTTLNNFKVEVVPGKALSTNDYTNQDKAAVTSLTYLTGYTPENSANKQNSMAIDNSGVKYPTVDAVNLLANNICKAVVNTGFLSKLDTFELYSASTTSLGIIGSSDGIAFSSLFQSSVAPSDGIKFMTSRTVPLSNIGLTGTGTSIKYVGYRASDDSIVFSDSTFIQSPTICQLGLVLVKYSAGTTSFIDSVRNFINQPDIAQYSNLETIDIGVRSDIVVDHLTNDLRLKNTSGTLIGVSVNWHGANNDIKPISGSTSGGTVFTYLHPGNALTTTPPSTATTIDPTVYWNGSALVSPGNANSATIQRFLVTLRGNIAVQYGETAYASYNSALNNATVQTFTNVLPAGTFCEIGRLVVQKDATDLSNPLKAEFIVTGGGGSGSGGIASTTLWGQINGDVSSQTDLITILNTKTTQTGSTNTIPKIIGSTTLGSSNITDNGTVVAVSTDMSINSIKAGKGSGNIGSNTAFGANAINSNVSGINVTAFGVNALASSLGDYNTAVGAHCLANVTSGQKNSGFGTVSLNGVTIGVQNIGIGYNSGRYITDGLTNNTNPTNSIFIGIETRALADNASNEIVIGSNNTGLGTNTTVIGNPSTTITRLRGEVRGGSFVKDGGLPTQYLMADGSTSTGTTSGGGGISGSGTAGKIPLWNSASALTNAVVGVDYSLGTYLLATGIVKNTTGTGVLSIATSSDFPNMNGNVTGTTNTIGKFTSSGLSNSNITDSGTVVAINSAAQLTVNNQLNISGSGSYLYTSQGSLGNKFVSNKPGTGWFIHGVYGTAPNIRWSVGLHATDPSVAPTTEFISIFDANAVGIGGVTVNDTVNRLQVNGSIATTNGHIKKKASNVNTTYATVANGELVMGARGGGLTPMFTSRTSATTTTAFFLLGIQNADTARTAEADMLFRTGFETGSDIIQGLTTSGSAFSFQNATVSLVNIFRNGNTVISNIAVDNGVDKLQVGGSVNASQYKISALNTAPSSATDTGVLGEIRYDANYMYVCTATNTWKRSALSSW